MREIVDIWGSLVFGHGILESNRPECKQSKHSSGLATAVYVSATSRSFKIDNQVAEGG
jgi:hypothetical protein